MRQIKPLTSTDYSAAAILIANAYPNSELFTEDDRKRLVKSIEKSEQYPPINFYGLFDTSGSDSEQLLGVMRYHDYEMKLLSANTLVGGIGGIAVDLAHRKEKIARDMLLHFLRHYREQGACLTLLYPFRPDFYRDMGFGNGPKMNQYRFRPDKLPNGPSKANVTLLQESDLEALGDCYRRFRDQTNGLFSRDRYALNNLLQSPGVQAAGFKQGSRILGYLVYKFRAIGLGHLLRHELVVTEFIYETPEALWQLLTFLHSLADQVERIEFNTLDEHFHQLLADPRNDSGALLTPVWHQSNVQGVGLMYRIINTSRFFEVLADHTFGGQSCRLKITLTDTFLPENGGSTFIDFKDGRGQLYSDDGHDVEIELDVSDFSSLVVGAITFERLKAYGLAQISDERYLRMVDRLFHVDQKPMCLTSF